MQVELNPDGTRNTQYRPHILLEETTYNTVLYNPHQSHNYGLYQDDPHVYQPWVEHVTDRVNKLTRSGYLQDVSPPDNTLQTPQYQNYASAPARNSVGSTRMYRRLHAI